ncbi:uridine nucleosidase [Anaeramoeba ignava]|uniref:Uridine nucleosidase n=1 Tax=Anaeramoeba ignava TaxID=1746090 RepID=A0A9Q0LU36_ANAIG|nr:uridine nucleosidase [Anaeramoeba ignava]
MEKIPVILDCDPGHDDSFAIILSSFSSRIDLKAIITEGGNQTIQKTTQNALKTLTVIGKQNIPVIQGQDFPLMIKERVCPEIHGETGLDGTEFPPVEVSPVNVKDGKVIQKGVVFLAEFIEKQEKPITLVCTARLTNIALLFTLYPELTKKIQQVVLLAGAIGSGNITPVSEFNILGDPHAAKILFDLGEEDLKIVMVPLEVSHTVLVTEQIFERIRKETENSKFGKLCENLLRFFQKTYATVFMMEDPPLHDPVAVQYVVNPSIFQEKRLRVDIECCSPLSFGQTVVDIYQSTQKPKNVHVCFKVEVEKFWDSMINAIVLGK